MAAIATAEMMTDLERAVQAGPGHTAHLPDGAEMAEAG
ncbi:hypothetical protein ES707_03479 [subsurface metagenome]|jgi:hypothetical protein